MPPDLLKKFQARFLREIFRAPRSGFVLKGGLALNALYGSSRITMDIDLDFPPHPERSSQSLHGQINRAIRAALIGLGIRDIRISEPGRGEISPKWKVAGLSSDGSPFRVKVEVSRRPPIPAGTTRQLSLQSQLAPGLPVFYVDIYDESTLAAMKLKALMSPSRHAARDVYDLDLLIANGHKPDPVILGAMLDAQGIEKKSRNATLDAKLELLGWHDFETQMSTTLDPREAERFNPEEWGAMKLRVREEAASWLKSLADKTQ